MRIKMLFILIVPCITIKSQQVVLIDYNKNKNSYKDCSIIPTCIDYLFLKDDTLQILFTTRELRYNTEPELSYVLKYDTVEINYYPPLVSRDTIIYNKEKRKFEKAKYIEAQQIPIALAEDKGCVTFLFKFKGVQKIPNDILYNGGVLTRCPMANIEYDIFEGDTINIINKNGYKDGNWLEFYDNGNVRKRKTYKNGKFIEGYYYNILGEKTHIITESGIEIAIPINIKK